MKDLSAKKSRLLDNLQARESYIKSKVNVIVPSQIRALRLKSKGMQKQSDLAKIAEMKQSRISAIETPGAVNFNVNTLVRIAAAFGVGLKIEFVPFSEMLEWENNFQQDAFNPVRIEEDKEFLRDPQAAASSNILKLSGQLSAMPAGSIPGI